MQTSHLVGLGVAAALALSHARLFQFVRRKVCRVKLLYFDIPGLGEPIRYALAVAGVPFEDFRFASREDFIALKPSLRFGQVRSGSVSPSISG